MTQLAFDLGHRTAQGREDFLIAQPNAVAVAWIDRWPDWPSVGLALFGPAGCGKSHLAQVWRAASQAIEIAPAALGRDSLPELMGEASEFLIDGLGEALEGEPACQQDLLHLYNMVVERGGHLVIVGQRPPSHWALELPDLASRLATFQAIELGPPDDALLGAVLVKLIDDRQLKIKGEVITYLLARMERSFAAAHRLIAAADQLALAQQREITVPLMRQVLEADDTAQHSS